MGERDQRAGAAPRGGLQEPDLATWVGEEGRTKEKIVLHSQEKVKLYLMLTPYPLFLDGDGHLSPLLPVTDLVLALITT